jgi:hypothetical protein
MSRGRRPLASEWLEGAKLRARQLDGIDDAVFYDNRLIGIHPRVHVAAVVLNECLRTSILKKSVVSGQ